MKVCTFVGVPVLALAGLVVLPRAADAHFTLMSPTSWTTEASGKGGFPCGASTGPTNVISPATGGHPLMVQVKETVPHRGHYRIALAINSRSELPPDPGVKNKAGAVITTGMSDSAVIQKPAVFPIVEDEVFPHAGTIPAGMMFQKEIMLPNISCTKCTLQIIEFMADHDPDYFYRHCADLKITMDPALPPFQAGGSDGGASDAAKPADATGAGGSGGMTGSGGTIGTGGATGSGGTTGSGGATGTGGTTASGGASGSGTGGSATTGTGGSKPPPGGGGGGCTVAGVAPRGGAGAVLGLLGIALLARRRRSSSHPPCPPSPPSRRRVPWLSSGS